GRFAGLSGYASSASATVTLAATAVNSPGLASATPQALGLAANLTPDDYNNDGHLDLAADNTVLTLRGKGDGTFNPISSTQPIGGSSTATCDVNGDGNVDLAYLGVTPSVALGNGDATFHSISLSYVSATLTALACADVNRDGKPDLVFS